jgi:hypothetical protein
MDGGAMSRRLLMLAGMLALSACATQPALYSWGSYEEVIYASYAAAGDVPPEQQIEVLEKDFQVARAKQLRMPPGWHAHLGYLYYQVGKTDQARQEFATEKTEFPESAVLVDRLLANLQKP